MDAGNSGGANPKDNRRINGIITVKIQKAAALSAFRTGAPHSGRRVGKNLPDFRAAGEKKPAVCRYRQTGPTGAAVKAGLSF